MSDPSRIKRGFSDLSGGMDGGQAASLIAPNQAALLVNTTVRGSFAATRPSFAMPSVYDPSNVAPRWTGQFQGSMYYDVGAGASGWVVSRGGYLFFIPEETRKVRDITPRLLVVTTKDYVPANGFMHVNDELAFTVGQNIIVDSGSYTVVNIFEGEIQVTYNGGAAHNPCLAGTAVYDSTGTKQLVVWLSNPSGMDFIYMFQAENYAIILGGQHPTIIFDGTLSRRAAQDEIPPGVLGAYGWGRIWVCASDRRRFVAGNLVFDRSGGGTLANEYRDSILKFTDNDFLNEGGAFAVPINSGEITSMQFLATQDTSLGVGVLLVSTTNMVFSVNAPVDRTTWKNLSYPIQTVSLLDYGPEGPRSAVPINGDMWYRSSDGFRSFIVARRNFGQPGNTPLSHEVNPLLEDDTEELLFYGSGVLFSNRLLQTVSPYRTSLGVAHRGLAVVNFDLVSEMRQKRAPCWEGAWTGLNILQVMKCRIDGEERGFAFVAGPTDIELWELRDDDTCDLNVTTRVPIKSVIETRSDDYGQPDQVKKLRLAELFIDEITDNVTIAISFRPDQYPQWVPWATLNFCFTVSQCTFTSGTGTTCMVFTANAKGYAAGIKIPQPPESCNTIGNQTVDRGNLFQFRLDITGSCRIRGFYAHVNLVTEPSEGECPADVQCVLFPDCGTPIFGVYDSHG